ncbi:MAG TPA: long-chain-fatty-acid--CoA ligase [Blastocatellia bacterium]|nr:long-chain-fatty-acid--CoA ligase [Blastocatellia bacterium]
MNLPLTPIRFKRRAETIFGNKLGVVCGDVRLTYSEYGQRANRLSNALAALSVHRGERVAWLGYNCHRLLEAYYGVVQVGAVLLPLNIRLTPAEIAFILQDSGSVALFYDLDFLPIVQQLRKEGTGIRNFVPLEGGNNDQPSYEALLSAASPEFDPPGDINDDEMAELFYTSGTTANPKGVMVTHRNLYVHGLQVMAGLGIKDSNVQLHTIPLFHVNGWGTPHSISAAGGRHVIIKKFDPNEVLALVQRERVTHFSMVPTMATALINCPSVKDYDLSSLEFVQIGGSASPVDLIREVEQTLGCGCYAGYGLTETTPVCTVSFLKEHLKSLPDQARWRRQAMTGYPIPGVEMDIMDSEDRVLPHDGVSAGEIVVRADNVMAGYWKREEETAQVIRDGWFHTGDMAVVDEDGYFLIVDRKKDIIISGGENISSIEVEKAVYSHPSVLECAVIAIPDDRWGEVPKALVVLKPGATLTVQELIDYCRTQLPGFKIPKSIEFLGALPKGGTGKILKKELREQYWAGHSKRVH